MNPLVQALIGAIVVFLTSSTGYWVYLKNRRQISDEEQRHLIELLLGLAQTNITYLGMKYIERGWVSRDEFADLQRYLYEPYLSLGGNGTVERIMHAVERLPLKNERPLLETAYQHIPIRETDPTGFKLPHKNYNYEGEERRDQ